MRRPLLKLVAFFAVTGMATGYLGILLGETQGGGPECTVNAVFSDVSFLRTGDAVRIAGVPVGKVSSLRIRPDATVLVTMRVAGTPQLTDGTEAAIKYKNLIGDRYVALAEGHGTGKPLPENGIIPVTRTKPALDLDVLVGGFQPLFAAISPQQVNDLSWSLIQVLQGEAGALNSFLTSVSSVTGTLADRDQLIGEVIGNLNAALATFNDHDQQISEIITQTRQLIDGLAADRRSVTDAVTQLNGLTGSAAELIPRLRPDLAAEIHDLGTASQTLNANEEQVGFALRELPVAYERLSRIGVHGTFFNAYLCSVRVRLSGPDGEFVYTPWIDSTVRRCTQEAGN